MVTISQDFLNVYARVGRFVKYYETVTELLDATDTYEENEIVQAGQYFYKGAASGATDHHLANDGGAKLYCVGTPYVTPDQFGAAAGTANNVTAVTAAIASGIPVFLNRIYRVGSPVYFPAGVSGITIVGGTAASTSKGGLYGTSLSQEAILQTSANGDSTTSSEHFISNISITGLAKRGLVINQCHNVVVENLNGFLNTGSGTAGTDNVTTVVVEEAYNVTLRSLQLGYGATTDLQVNRGVSDLNIDLFYTTNSLARHHIDISAERVEVSTAANGLNGPINIYTPVLQGATGYGIKVLNQKSLSLHNIYQEAEAAILLVKACEVVNFFDGELGGTNSNHTVWLDHTEDGETSVVNFFGSFNNKPIVIGDVRSVNLIGSPITMSQLRRTNSSYKLKTEMPTTGSTATQVTQMGQYVASGGSQIALKCSDGSKFSNLTVDSSGTVTGTTPYDLTDASANPITPVVWWPNAGNPTWASGGAITPVTVGCKGGNGTYTFTIVGGSLPTGTVAINSSTGQITGTPSTPGTYSFRVRATDSTSGRNYWDETRLITATVT